MSGDERRVTLKMIAQRAGVSIGTVDRALNHRAGVSPESETLIVGIAKEMGYRPNKLASALGRKKAIQIGVAYPQAPEEFYSDMSVGIDDAAEELRDYGVTVEKLRYKSTDPERVMACLNSINPSDYDGLAVNSPGPLVKGRINELVRAKTPVVTFNTDTPDSDRLFYVGNDSRQSGVMGGQLLSMLINGRGSVTVLGNFTQITPFIDRFGGFCESIQLNNQNISIIPCSECKSDTGLASQILIDLLDRQPDIDGIFCTGYSTTVGAAVVLKQQGRRDIRVVGYDITERTAQYLNEGWCDALLYQSPYLEGYRAVTLLARHIMEGWEPAQKRVIIDTQIVIKSNIGNYLNKTLIAAGV
jgi:LacI family transcriptional regulator